MLLDNAKLLLLSSLKLDFRISTCNYGYICVLTLDCFDYVRVKKMTKMTENVANGILSGVIKVSGFFTSSVANTKVGKKFFSLLPGEIVLATLDGFSKYIIDLTLCGYL